jgi:hypothetical protein
MLDTGRFTTLHVASNLVVPVENLVEDAPAVRVSLAPGQNGLDQGPSAVGGLQPEPETWRGSRARRTSRCGEESAHAAAAVSCGRDSRCSCVQCAHHRCQNCEHTYFIIVILSPAASNLA